VRTFHHAEFPPARLAERQATASVCVPARNEAATIEATVGTLIDLRDQGAVDQVVVVDGASTDGTATIAGDLGAQVHQQDELIPRMGPALGKGDAMWRSLTVLDGEIVCFVDADSEDFGPHFPCGLLGPILFGDGVQYAKGFFRRPFKSGEAVAPEGGGRVTELTARPLLEVFYPELGDCWQPLAGEIAARRSLLERLPWATGYGVEIAQLIDVYRLIGVGAMAQVDLDVRQNRHQPLSALRPMAASVVAAVAQRLVRERRLDSAPPTVERPPLRSLRVPVSE